MRLFQHQAKFGIWLAQTKYFPSLGLCNAQSKCYKVKGYFNLERKGQADLSLLCSTSQWTYRPQACCLTLHFPPLQSITWKGGKSFGWFANIAKLPGGRSSSTSPVCFFGVRWKWPWLDSSFPFLGCLSFLDKTFGQLTRFSIEKEDNHEFCGFCSVSCLFL